MLDELNGQAFEYRWATRAICLDKIDAAKLFTRIRGYGWSTDATGAL